MQDSNLRYSCSQSRCHTRLGESEIETWYCVRGSNPSLRLEGPRISPEIQRSVKFGGPGEDRTPTKGLQSPCAPIITTGPNKVADYGSGVANPLRQEDRDRYCHVWVTFVLADQAGLEPATTPLTAERSTN